MAKWTKKQHKKYQETLKRKKSEQETTAENKAPHDVGMLAQPASDPSFDRGFERGLAHTRRRIVAGFVEIIREVLGG